MNSEQSRKISTPTMAEKVELRDPELRYDIRQLSDKELWRPERLISLPVSEPGALAAPDLIVHYDRYSKVLIH